MIETHAASAYSYPLLIKHLLHTPLACHPQQEIVSGKNRFSYHTVTGDGSLGLAPSADDAPTPLSGPPPVREYAPVSEHVASALRKLSAEEIALALARRFGAPIQ